MTGEEILLRIEGAKEVVEWFGSWPSLHDAEVIDVHLKRGGVSSVTIHVFRMTREVDSSGHYINDRYALLTFALSEVTDSELLGFNHQNVTSGVLIEQEPEGFRIVLGGCYGLEGWILTKSLCVGFLPGIPQDSIYGATRSEKAML